MRRANALLKLEVDLSIEGPLDSMDPAVAQDLLAVLAETLSNVTRHARAGSAEKRIESGETVRLTVVDDGVGIPADVPLSGLGSIRERAARHGGHLSLGQAPGGGGTCLVWTATAPSGRAVLRDVSGGVVAGAGGPSGSAPDDEADALGVGC